MPGHPQGAICISVTVISTHVAMHKVPKLTTFNSFSLFNPFPSISFRDLLENSHRSAGEGSAT